jgi:hypothetical protein
VFNWKTASRRVIPVNEDTDINAFSASVLRRFEDEIDTMVCSLFYVTRNDPVTDKCRITTDNFKAKVDECVIASRNGHKLPAIYFHNDASSPQTSPLKQDNAKSIDNNSSSYRSGQSDFNSRILRRDGGKCVFCGVEATDAAHLIDANIIDMFKECKISGIQDTPNGLATCTDCHLKFDTGKLFINPTTKAVEISGELEEITKFQNIKGKVLTSSTSFGLFPTSPLMKTKYNSGKRKENIRITRHHDKTVQCTECGKFCKSDAGVQQHKRMGGCASYKTSAKSK